MHFHRCIAGGMDDGEDIGGVRSLWVKADEAGLGWPG